VGLKLPGGFELIKPAPRKKIKNKEEREMLQKAIEMIMEKEVYKYNDKYAADMRADAEKIYNAGWDGLSDGTVLQYKGNQVAIKNGSNLEVWKMANFYINMGKLEGDKISMTKYKSMKSVPEGTGN
jgi:single-stranded DNA-specific DHH superfamily exonuclease